MSKLLMYCRPSWLIFMMLSLSVLSVQAEEVDGITILKRMSQASKELNFEGVFAYQSGKNFQSIQIFHRSDARGERERLISLSGAAREVIRSDDMVTCISPEGKKINVSQRPFGQGFPSDLPRRLSAATEYYNVEIEGQKRIAGRQATQLRIIPVDDYRYGYRLWVDDESYLLLKSELIAENDAVLESFEFSTVNTGIHITEHDLQSQLSEGAEIKSHRLEPNGSESLEAHDDKTRWLFDWLPDGFSLVAYQTRMRSKNGSLVDQRVFSDGLSSLSVFIEKIRAHHDHLHGGSHMGGVNAYGKILNAHFVTVVGEVPAVTVEKVGDGIRFKETLGLD